jgi:hypothetical protein
MMKLVARLFAVAMQLMYITYLPCVPLSQANSTVLARKWFSILRVQFVIESADKRVLLFIVLQSCHIGYSRIQVYVSDVQFDVIAWYRCDIRYV